MRKAGIILCVLILTGGFVAAWVVLSPGSAMPGANELAEGADQSSAFQPLDSPGAVPDADNAESGDSPIGIARERDTDGPDVVRESDSDPSGGETKPGIDAERTTPRDPGTPEAGKMPASQDADRMSTPPDKPALFIKGHTRPAGQNLGNVRPRSRRLSQPAGVKKLDDVTPKLRQDRRGLYAQYFGLNSADLTRLDTSSPDMVRIDRQVYFPDREAFSDLPISLDNFAAEWTGFLVIDEPGDYWLFWGADNGGRVELAGETVLLQDGMVRYVEVSTVLTLEAGLHPLKIEFAQTKNNVADWAKCAAALMWVPEGESKPVPVPPEMLMVPEWMWSDNAPIITKLSKAEGEIGDEITIKGQGLAGNSVLPAGSKDGATIDFIKADNVRVTFAGQAAKILESSDASLRVRVPIGARTGEVTVYRAKFIAVNEDSKVYDREIPSNSVEFTVTTQFGLMAQWYDMEGWSNYDFVDGSQRSADTVRIEENPQFESRDQLGLPFQQHPLACHWEGKIGLPADWIRGKMPRRIRISAHGRMRVRLGELEPVYSLEYANADLPVFQYEFEFEKSEEQYLSLSVDWTCESDASQFKIEELMPGTVLYSGHPPHVYWDILSWSVARQLPPQWLFPPVVPPKPPVISNVQPVWAEGEQPAVLPYDADLSRPSVKVGQEFTFLVADFGPPEIWDTQPSVTVDGIALEYTVVAELPTESTAERVLHCRATMPPGVGEGRMVARLSIVNSEPVLIDITNRGLVAYLYDIPEPSGLNELPDLGPLHSFKVRKDRQINFESAADFDLPFPAETFVIEWLGGLIIEEEGDYEFICRSDDGMKLWLDDNVVIDANHRQAPAENKATVHLVPGTYRFRMQFFENNQHEVCVLEWRATRGEGAMLETLIPREVIPARAFSLDVHPPFPAKTSTGKRTDGS